MLRGTQLLVQLSGKEFIKCFSYEAGARSTRALYGLLVVVLGGPPLVLRYQFLEQ
ncbi:hypothetical protein PV367_20945 [Streptomyces europaeiscabiei]|uniref:Uncharacterized protein n=1 Tax=Streptomyces europaeiscabiei TaxID=146819 RepID=A0AAJ2PRV3_9ACTN|nr:hypothetical protein [Streptomyces europaeiscabiei]MDX3132204.1 hypothetical protein [Streptomyces europaeiscabiei]